METSQRRRTIVGLWVAYFVAATILSAIIAPEWLLVMGKAYFELAMTVTGLTLLWLWVIVPLWRFVQKARSRNGR